MTQGLLHQIQIMKERLAAGQSPPAAEMSTLLQQIEDHLAGSARQAQAERINQALPPEGGSLVASRIADRGGYTRSVLVSTIRKVQSAGLVDAHSLGASGTMIRFRDGLTAPVLLAALLKRKNPAA